MFTEQIQQLNTLRGKLPDGVIDALTAVIGQCANALTHRGPVTIDVHPDRLRNAPCHNISEGEVAAGLTVKAYGGRYTRDEAQVGEGTLCGPVAIFADGGVYSRPNADGFSFIGECVDIRCVYGESADFDDLNAPTVRWAVVTDGWKYGLTIPSQGGGTAWITCRVCDDESGTNPTGDEFDVWAPVSAGQDPNVETGDVILVKKSNSNWVCEHSGDDAIGTVKWMADTAAAGDVVMRGWRVVTTSGGGPQGRTTWALDEEETFVMTAVTGVLDKGGTRDHTHDPHEGGIDDHVMGGDTSHEYTGIVVYPGYSDSAFTDITVAYHPPFNTNSAYTGFTIEDHDDHYHNLIVPGNDYDTGTENDNAVAHPDDTPDTSGTIGYDGATDYVLAHEYNDPMHYHGVAALYHYVTDPGHQHYVQTQYYDPGHDHSWSYTAGHEVNMPHGTTEHIPPYIRLYLIERINNGTSGASFGGGGPF